jgi:hypothetical protein
MFGTYMPSPGGTQELIVNSTIHEINFIDNKSILLLPPCLDDNYKLKKIIHQVCFKEGSYRFNFFLNGKSNFTGHVQPRAARQSSTYLFEDRYCAGYKKSENKFCIVYDCTGYTGVCSELYSSLVDYLTLYSGLKHGIKFLSLTNPPVPFTSSLWRIFFIFIPPLQLLPTKKFFLLFGDTQARGIKKFLPHYRGASS